MATSFPGALDSFTNPSASDALDSATVGHAGQHANINDAMEAVQAKLGVGAGTIGTWTSYTPTLTNFTVTGLDVKYCKINNIVFVHYRFNVDVMSGVPSFTMPTTIGDVDSLYGHSASMLDRFSAWYAASTVDVGTGVGWFVFNASGTYTTLSNTNASNPFTWASGDTIIGNMWYVEA